MAPNFKVDLFGNSLLFPTDVVQETRPPPTWAGTKLDYVVVHDRLCRKHNNAVAFFLSLFKFPFLVE